MKFDKTYDEPYMRRALELAAEGRYTTSPNPKVGAVVVSWTGPLPIVVGEGFHLRPGEPHAEILALRQAGEAARGASLYLNLEPCCHYGRTPPCVDAIIEAGIARVVAAMEDPFPEVAGRGIEKLRNAGVEVELGVCAEEAQDLNRFFLCAHRLGRPWVILKMAMSLDGKTATRTGDSCWISSEESRARVHDLRAQVDAILVGSGTALRDRPHLTARPEGVPTDRLRQPKRIVLDTTGRLFPSLDAIQDLDMAPLEILVGSDVDCSSLPASHVEVTTIPPKENRLPPDEVLQHLFRKEVQSVLIEGGQAVASSFLDAGLVDELRLFVAPILIGGVSSPGVYAGCGVEAVRDALRLRNMTVTESGGDVLIQGRLTEIPNCED